MWNCEDCGEKFPAKTAKHRDPRPDGLYLGDELCIDCHRGACQEAIQFHLSEIERITTDLINCTKDTP